jgi:hypothetical protein
MTRSSESSEIDSTSSQPCTKAGTFALLVSVVLLLLTMYWQDRKNDEALAGYVGSRWNLAIYVEDLDKDEIWRKYTESHPDAERTPIDRLIHQTVEISVGTAGKQETQTSSLPDVKPSKTETQRAPAVPTVAPAAGLTATFVSHEGLYEIPYIVQYMRELNNAQALTRAGRVNNFFSVSIAKWGQLRNTFMYGNSRTGVCNVDRLEVPTRLPKGPGVFPQLDDEALLKCLTLQDVRELARFELPDLSNPI